MFDLTKGASTKKLVFIVGVWCLVAVQRLAGDSGSGGKAGETERPRHRVVVFTDIGCTDPDDSQSMVHLLVYADEFNIEGLVSSPYGQGRKDHILQVIDLYERDYGHLRTYSDKYPTPDELQAVTRQGAIEGERIRLEDAVGQTILDCEYNDNWYKDTDGRGYSLTIIDAANPDSNSWSQKQCWRVSASRGGSPR